MIDIHCHILPGIDDGPSEISETIAMFRIAAADGITHIVATPHYRYGEAPTAADIEKRAAEVSERVAKEKIPVEVLWGADVHLTYELLEGLGREDIPTLNSSRYFLLEFPELLPPHTEDLIFEAKVKGYVPIITHPERNYSILSKPERIAQFREAGALIQITGRSMTGGFGSEIRHFCQTLLKKELIDFVASDGHSTERRPPVLSEAYHEVARLSNDETARRLFVGNPRSVIENREI